MSDVTLAERIAWLIARDIADEEVGFTGLLTGAAAARFGTGIPLAAMELARRTHAPGMTILLGGCYHNPDVTRLTALPSSEHDALLRDLECDARMTTYPGPWVLKRGDVDFGFSSAVQVDREGNINSVCIGDHARPKVRLVGPILQPEHMTLFGREYVMMPSHERRQFVEKVDFVSGVGYPGGLAGRAALGLPATGPRWVVTPRCIFDFDRAAGRMTLRSIHPGADRTELQAATGFDLGPLGDIPETETPPADTLRLLREVVDPRRVLLA
jgi:glutaconate CoA-transferase, subunit B